MRVWRKPESALWYYDSAQIVDSVDIGSDAWTEGMYITFDATKDKNGDRHTTMRIELSEAEVERLYAGLQKGRKRELKRLASENAGLDKKLIQATEDIEKTFDSLQESWYQADAGSEEEKTIERAKSPLKRILKKWRGY